MTSQEFLTKVAYKKLLTLNDPMNISFEDNRREYEVWLSKFDNSYITQVGMEHDVNLLACREITEQLTHGVGYSPKDGKWYGWSHRTIFGFQVGSTCKKGDCHYFGSSLKEQEEAAISFWKDPYHVNVRCTGIIEEHGEKFFDIKWECSNTTPNKELRISGCKHYITPLGKGEWVAKTMEDAKQMAIDFSKGVE